MSATRGSRRVWLFSRASTSALSTTPSRLSRAGKLASGRSWTQLSIMKAARRPAPTARVMSLAPLVTSPAAKRYGTSVCRVLGSTLIRLPSATPARRSNGAVSGAIPIAEITASHGISNSLPWTGSGRRRPEASGAPSTIFWQRSALTLPSASARTETGATRNSKATPSFSASSTSATWAGIWSRPRR